MRFLITLAALALTACAGMTPQQIAGTASSGLYAAATIAQAGTIDERLAPLYTANAMTRQRAARMLQDGRIDTATARAVLSHTDAARAALDEASNVQGDATVWNLSGLGWLGQPAGAIEKHIATARDHIATAEHLMELPK